jgi:hypothetical protein
MIALKAGRTAHCSRGRICDSKRERKIGRTDSEAKVRVEEIPGR